VIDSISRALDRECIRLELNGRKKPEIVRELVDVLASAGKIDDAEAITRLVLEREALTSTAIGDGIAIPHCLSDSVTRTTMAFGRKRGGAKFNAVDKRPVELFFLMVGPPDSPNEHLRLLSRLSRYLHDPGLRESLLSATDADEVLRLFREREQ